MPRVCVVAATVLLLSLASSASLVVREGVSFQPKRETIASGRTERKWGQRFGGQMLRQEDDDLLGAQDQGEGSGEGSGEGPGEGAEGTGVSSTGGTAANGGDVTGYGASGNATGEGANTSAGEGSTENGGDSSGSGTATGVDGEDGGEAGVAPFMGGSEGADSSGSQGNTTTGTGEEGKTGADDGGTDADGGTTTTGGEDAGASADGGEEKEPPTTENTTPEAPTAGNETAAFLAFSLLQMQTVNEEDAEFRMVPIFKNGSLTGAFGECPTTSDFETVGTASDDTKWYSDGAYADRMSLQYTFIPDSKDYEQFSPEVDVDGVSPGIEPRLIDEDHDLKGGSGHFTLLYRCKSGGQERNRISLHMQVTKTHSVDMMWVKVCGSGRFEHMIFGFVSSDDDVTPFNADGTYGTEEQHILEVGPTQLSTVLSAELQDPAWDLDFEDPYVHSDSDLVSISLRETIAGGTLNTDKQTKFSILYTCEQTSARANIVFTFAIPPWDNVTAKWRKVCGGTHSQGLLIGTSGAGSYEVMQDGELNEKYNVTESTSLEKAYGDIEDIDKLTNSKRFYITNSDSAELYVQTIVTTMSNPEVVRALIEVPFGIGSYLTSSGGTIEAGDTKSLKLRFVCLKLGESLVMVTLPIQKFKNVEFGFIKQCSEPKVYHQSGFLSTAGSLLSAIMVLSICGGIALWVYLRRRSSRKYMAVPTSERDP